VLLIAFSLDLHGLQSIEIQLSLSVKFKNESFEPSYSIQDLLTVKCTRVLSHVQMYVSLFFFFFYINREINERNILNLNRNKASLKLGRLGVKRCRQRCILCWSRRIQFVIRKNYRIM
jgi:hypothetical protein